MLLLNGSYIQCEISHSGIIPINSYLVEHIYVDFGMVTLCDMKNMKRIQTNFDEFNKCVFTEISNNENDIQKVLDKIKKHFYTNHLVYASAIQRLLAYTGSFNFFSKKYNDISELFDIIDKHVLSLRPDEKTLFDFIDEIKLRYILDKL